MFLFSSLIHYKYYLYNYVGIVYLYYCIVYVIVLHIIQRTIDDTGLAFPIDQKRMRVFITRVSALGILFPSDTFYLQVIGIEMDPFPTQVVDPIAVGNGSPNFSLHYPLNLWMVIKLKIAVA